MQRRLSLTPVMRRCWQPVEAKSSVQTRHTDMWRAVCCLSWKFRQNHPHAAYWVVQLTGRQVWWSVNISRFIEMVVEIGMQIASDDALVVCDLHVEYCNPAYKQHVPLISRDLF